MKKLREYKTLGCNFTVYDEGIEIHSLTSNRFIKKEQITDVTISNFLPTVSIRLNTSKEIIKFHFSSKNIRNNEHQRLGSYLQGKLSEEEYFHQPIVTIPVNTQNNGLSPNAGMNTWNGKGGKAILIIVIILFSIILIDSFVVPDTRVKTSTEQDNKVNDSNIESNPEKWNLPTTTASSSIEKSSDLTKDILATRIKNLKEPFNSNPYRKDISALEDEIDLFRTYGKIYNEHVYHSDKEVRALAEELKKQLIILQRSEFPKMRQAYAKMADELMWEKDIDVEVSGTGNKTVTLTGSIFASNANIKSTQLQLNDIFVKFRFSQVRFKWSEYATEYQSYETDAPDDEELVL